MNAVHKRGDCASCTRRFTCPTYLALVGLGVALDHARRNLGRLLGPEMSAPLPESEADEEQSRLAVSSRLD